MLTSYFWSGDVLRSRSVSDVIWRGALVLPAPPVRLLADCQREVARLGLEAGDVEPLSLARARTRWPDYRICVQAVSDWMHAHAMAEALDCGEVALMACRGARYHHDAAQYGGAVFCNVFLSDDRGLDLHFPATGDRIALTRGTVVVFDTGQPHAVIRRCSSGFNAADFGPEQDCTQLFLSWELPVDNAGVASAMQLAFDTDPSTPLQLSEEPVWLNGVPVSVCPDSGRWCRAD